MNRELNWQIAQCEGSAQDFSETVIARALEDTDLPGVLQALVDPRGVHSLAADTTKTRLIRQYLTDAMEAIYSEKNDDKSDRADIYDRLAERRSESVDDEIDRRKDDLLTGDRG